MLTRRILLVVLTMSPALAFSQAAGPTIRGKVVSAASSAPIEGATITLTPESGRAVLTPGASAALPMSLSTSSGADGEYAFASVPPVRYQMHVRRLGYHAAVFHLDLSAGGDAPRLSAALVEVPVRLHTVHIDDQRPSLFGRAISLRDEDGDLRVHAAQQRQARHLGTDVRELTYADLVAGSALGDADLFRAFRRLPGVSGFDEYSTELWIRGARWDQTRVFFDGLPLFNPFHHAGEMSGISGEMIDAAVLHPGVRSVSLPGQGASLVDIQSRSAGPGLNVVGELSLLGGTAAVDHRSPSGKFGVTASTRRSLRIGQTAFGEHYFANTGGYAEVSARADADLGGGRSLTLSGLSTQDVRRGGLSLPGLGQRNGTQLARATITLPAGGFVTRHTIGLSDHGSSGVASPMLYISDSLGGIPAEFLLSVRSDVEYTTLFGDIRRAGPADSTRWRLGYQLVQMETRQRTPAHLSSWSDLSNEIREFGGALQVGSIWGERRWSPTSRLTINTGIRGDIGAVGPVALHVGPSIQAHYAIDPLTRFSIGASRTFQDQQQVPFRSVATQAMGGSWFVTGPDVPRLVADQANAGIERWLGKAILLDANVYGRRLANVLAQPLPSSDTTSRTRFVPTTITAGGIELAARKMSGRVTGGLAYSYGVARTRMNGASVFADGDRRHVFEGNVMLRAGNFRFGIAYTAVSGLPYYPMTLGSAARDSTGAAVWTALPAAGPQGRGPGSATTDLFIDWTRRIRGVKFSVYLGIQNTLDQGNPSRYAPGARDCLPPLTSQPLGGVRCVGQDTFYSAISHRMNLGVRIYF